MSIAGLETVQTRGNEYSSSKPSVLGKDDFLHLLVAQLKAQDPLNPMESTEFTAPLAQFSSLEQLHNINENLGNIQATQASFTNSQSVGFIGKTVSAAGNSIGLKDGVSDDIHYELSADAKTAFIHVYDAHGNFVKGIENHGLSAGKQILKWDGTDEKGNAAPDGIYTFEVFAVDSDDEAVNATTFMTGKVTGVTFKNGTARLLAENREIPLNTVIEVSETTD